MTRIIATSAALLGLATAHAADPKFKRQEIDDAISIGYGLAIGDVDGDKKPDILLADASQIAWYRNGDWKRFNIAENLNPRVGTRFRDNVCIAARDIDGDGKVEIAVGGQWNPGETNDDSKSGSVHFLVRPDDPTKKWKPVRLHHEPTVHRMHWVRTTKDKFQLIVLPLHGRGNKNAQGAGVKVLAYDVPENLEDSAAWKTTLIDESMHATHNFGILRPPGTKQEGIAVAGKEGVKYFAIMKGEWKNYFTAEFEGGLGEVRDHSMLSVGISPMHGNKVIIYDTEGVPKVIDDTLSQGHAIAIGDVLKDEAEEAEIVAGWRSPDKGGKVGIKLYTLAKDNTWETHLIDDNGMACEDLKLADLDGDGKKEIIAAGRATKNVVIYWNKN